MAKINTYIGYHLFYNYFIGSYNIKMLLNKQLHVKLIIFFRDIFRDFVYKYIKQAYNMLLTNPIIITDRKVLLYK